VTQSRNQVGIGDEQAAKCDRINFSLRASVDGEMQVVIVVANVGPGEHRPQLVEVDVLGHCAGSARYTFDDMKVRKLEPVQLPDQVAIRDHDVAVEWGVADIRCHG